MRLGIEDREEKTKERLLTLNHFGWEEKQTDIFLKYP